MLYLDTEFNGFGGQLISMALVHPKGSEWYEVLALPTNIHPWVAENVVPFLDKVPVTIEKFKESLHGFLKFHSWNVRLQKQVPVHIYADWPEDFMHLLRLMFEDGGRQWDVEIIMHRIESGELHPTKPHNALCDARALMAWDLAQMNADAAAVDNGAIS